MPQILKTIEEYVVEDRKKDTLYIVFNTVYNDIHAFKKQLSTDDRFSKYLNKNYTDNEAREEFLSYMKTNYPDVKLEEVFDSVSAGYIEYPYLGSIAIDTDVNSNVYNALCEIYDDPNGDPKSNNAVLWYITFEHAETRYKKQKEFIEAELAND